MAAILDEKIAEMEKAGFLGDKLFGTDYSLRIYTHLGAGAYICGEETALLESIEGKRGQPRIRPPFPAVYGLYGKPTVVNNVETLANVPLIVDKGADWYKSLGTPTAPGSRSSRSPGASISPVIMNCPSARPSASLIYEYGGGVTDGRPVKAIMSAGASSSMIVADDKVLDTPDGLCLRPHARCGPRVGLRDRDR